MRRLFVKNPLILIPFSFLSGVAFVRAQDGEVAVSPVAQAAEQTVITIPVEVIAAAPRVLILPLVNHSRSRSHNPLAFGLPIALAERLEGEPAVEVINGPLVFTAAQAKVATPLAERVDLAAAHRLAKSSNARFFVTGEMRGKVEEWTFTVDVYEVAEGEVPRHVSSGSATGNLTMLKPRKPPKPGAVPSKKKRNDVYVQSSAMTHQLFAQATAAAFAYAGIALAPETVTAVATPATNDAYAFLLLGRAYGRHFHADAWAAANRNGDDSTALAFAEKAVRVDPQNPEARRFYAELLREAGNTASSRVHLEAALALRPKDVRSLAALGALEVAEGNGDVALRHLRAAAELWPGYADIRYWIGRANGLLQRKSEATAAYELARDIDPNHVDARQQLITIYADARRYRDAARELKAVAALQPNDKRVAFLLAACYRAAGLADEAIAALVEAEARFPREARFPLFRGDLLLETGNAAAAGNAYVTAFTVGPSNLRAAAMVAADHGIEARPIVRVPIGGREFLRLIAAQVTRAATMEAQRSDYSLAASDALIDLVRHGSDSCTEGVGIGSTVLAYKSGKELWSTGRLLLEGAADIRDALSNGEGAALTPDEEQAATSVLAAAARITRDALEIRAQYQHALVPLFDAKGCGDVDGPLVPQTVAQVRERNEGRVVVLPKYEPPAWGAIPIGPVVPPVAYRLVTFSVDNTEGAAAYVLTVDGEKLGTVVAGKKKTFVSRHGPHELCLAPEGVDCGSAGTRRQVFLHQQFGADQQFMIRVRPAS